MIPFIDLSKQYALIGDSIEASVQRVMRSGQYIMGPEVAELEDNLAAYVGVKHCVTCASGTDALQISLMALGVGPGDAVFVPAFTFFASAEVISLLGATPIFVDIDLDTFNISTESLKLAIQAVNLSDSKIYPLPQNIGTLKAKAIIAVDLFGLPANYPELVEVANVNGLTLIQDAAQSFGSTSNGIKAGSHAQISCTSFFPAKPLGCYGDGGAIFTNNDFYADLFRSIRIHGQGATRYENVRIGLTSRLDTIQAAILIEKIKIFDHELSSRNDVASSYTKLIQSRGIDLVTPQIPSGYQSSWAQYSILARDESHRNANIEALKKSGIPCMIYYPVPLHLQKAFAGLNYQLSNMPNAEAASKTIFSVPMHPYLTQSDLEMIISNLL